MSDRLSLTALRAADGARAGKTCRHQPDGRVAVIKDYPGIVRWTRHTHELPADLEALTSVIGAVARAGGCLVTGEPCGQVPLEQPARRLKHARDDHPATLAECSAAWLPVDLDKLLLKEPLDPLDPEAAITELLERLGEPFMSTSCCWQLTASASPGTVRVSCRLFFLADRPLDNAERRRWAEGLNAACGLRLVDPAIYSAAQPIYIADPHFDGAPDPFPRRLGILWSEREALPWAEVPIHAKPAAAAAWTPGQTVGDATIAGALARIGDAPGQGGIHEPIRDSVFRMVRAGWLPERIRSTIRASVAEADTSAHSPAYLAAKTSDRALNDSMKGAARRLAALELPERPELEPAQAVSLDIGQTIIRDAISRWMRGEGPARLVIDASVGVGKTRLALEAALADLPAGARLLWAAPTHQQGQEVLERLGDAGRRIRGRVHGDQPLCRRPELIEAIHDAGLGRHVQAIACQRPGAPACPYRGSCAYYAQFDGAERVRVIPHQLLAHPTARAHVGEWQGLVIDESPIAALTGHKGVKRSAIEPGVLARVVEMLEAGAEPDPALLPELEEEMRERCVVDLPVAGPGEADAWALAEELRRLAEKKTPRLAALYRGAIAWLGGARNALWIGTLDGAPAVYAAWRHGIGHERVLVLDGTAPAEAYRALLGPDTEIVRVRVRENLRVIQACDRPAGKRRLTGEDPDELAQACAVARALRAPILTHKTAIENATARGWLPGNHPRAHFGALRGLNGLETAETLVVAGRPEPPPLTVEATARALWPAEALNLTGAYHWAQSDGLSVASHADPRCDELLRAIRDGEVEQAIGRIRAARSPTLKTVVLLTSTPVSHPTERVPWAELLPSAKLARLLLAGDGVAPLAPELMCRLLPEAWPTPAAARGWLSRERITFPLVDISYKASVILSYRLEGQRCPSRVLSCRTLEETRARLEAMTGRAVVALAELPPPPPPDPPPRPRRVWEKPQWRVVPRWEKPAFVIHAHTFAVPARTNRRAPPRWERPHFVVRRRASVVFTFHRDGRARVPLPA